MILFQNCVHRTEAPKSDFCLFSSTAGQQTHPPCHQTAWIVLRQPIDISLGQMAVIRVGVYSPRVKRIRRNFAELKDMEDSQRAKTVKYNSIWGDTAGKIRKKSNLANKKKIRPQNWWINTFGNVTYLADKKDKESPCHSPKASMSNRPLFWGSLSLPDQVALRGRSLGWCNWLSLTFFREFTNLNREWILFSHPLTRCQGQVLKLQAFLCGTSVRLGHGCHPRRDRGFFLSGSYTQLYRAWTQNGYKKFACDCAKILHRYRLNDIHGS